MKSKYTIVIIYLLFIYTLPFILLFGLKPFIKPLQIDTMSLIHDRHMLTLPGEKRGSPAYDSIMGQDGWPHYRVFFWVPKEAFRFTPYADDFINTNVSQHGPAERWTVVQTNIINGNEKLVFIFVPKTFVYFYGKGFENVIHINYE